MTFVGTGNQISITNPIRNPAGGTITLSPNAAVLFVDGTASQVTISGNP